MCGSPVHLSLVLVGVKETRLKYALGTPWQRPKVRERSDQNRLGSKGRAKSGLKRGK